MPPPTCSTRGSKDESTTLPQTEVKLKYYKNKLESVVKSISDDLQFPSWSKGMLTEKLQALQGYYEQCENQSVILAYQDDSEEAEAIRVTEDERLG